jgi:hypothetical protein
MPEHRYPKEIVLKEHEEVILRPMAVEDSGELCRFYSELQPSLRWFMKDDPCDLEIMINQLHKGWDDF